MVKDAILKDLGELLNNHIKKTYEIALVTCEDFNLKDEAQLSKIKGIISDYYASITHQRQYNTVANAAVFYVLSQTNPLISFNYFHETFNVYTQSLKKCVKQIKKIESKKQ
ncbi:MAG: hypothetical protein WC376_01425 [Candidatus Nanoarchaeia archaeon]|jgi:hypothetical protein